MDDLRKQILGDLDDFAPGDVVTPEDPRVEDIPSPGPLKPEPIVIDESGFVPSGIDHLDPIIPSGGEIHQFSTEEGPTEEDLENWPDCPVEGCKFKICHDLDSDKCYQHTMKERQVSESAEEKIAKEFNTQRMGGETSNDVGKSEIDERYFSIINSAVEVRKRRKISQSEMAKKIGCSRQQLSLIENKNTRPAATLFLTYLDKLGIAIKFEFPNK